MMRTNRLRNFPLNPDKYDPGPARTPLMENDLGKYRGMMGRIYCIAVTAHKLRYHDVLVYHTMGKSLENPPCCPLETRP